jgi:hypothetical protein
MATASARRDASTTAQLDRPTADEDALYRDLVTDRLARIHRRS